MANPTAQAVPSVSGSKAAPREAELVCCELDRLLADHKNQLAQPAANPSAIWTAHVAVRTQALAPNAVEAESTRHTWDTSATNQLLPRSQTSSHDKSIIKVARINQLGGSEFFALWRRVTNAVADSIAPLTAVAADSSVATITTRP